MTSHRIYTTQQKNPFKIYTYTKKPIFEPPRNEYINPHRFRKNLNVLSEGRFYAEREKILRLANPSLSPSSSYEDQHCDEPFLRELALRERANLDGSMQVMQTRIIPRIIRVPFRKTESRMAAER